MRLALALTLLFPALALAQAGPKPKPIFFRDVRIFDGAQLTRGSVLVEGGVIRAVGPKVTAPPGAEVVDGKDRTLLPGFIDAHTHAYGDAALKQALLFGVTTELDMFGPPEKNQAVREREAGPAPTGEADLRSACTLATSPGGHGTEYGVPIPTLTRPDEAQAFVDARLKEGSDYIKIVFDDAKWFDKDGFPTLDAPTMKALVDAAHARKKLAVVHIGDLAGARAAITAGADGIVHLFVDRPPDPGFAPLVASRKAFVVPTLTVLHSMIEGGGGAPLAADPRIAPYLGERDAAGLHAGKPIRLSAALFANAFAAIKALRDANVDILAGTDAPNSGTMHGASIHRELELLVAAGLTPSQALAAATRLPAARFSLDDRGRIAPGLRADLVLVDGDPTRDILATRAIAGIWKRGVPVDRAARRAEVDKEREAIEAERKLPAPAGSESGLVSDFDDKDKKPKSSFGAGWAESTDIIFGGKSTVKMEIVSPGARGSAGALSLKGTVVAHGRTAWGGAMFSPGAAPREPANLSAKKRIRFLARGDGRRYRISLFARHTGPAANFRTFVAGPEWTEHAFALSEFNGLDGRDLLGLLFSSSPLPGAYAFQIDDVRFE